MQKHGLSNTRLYRIWCSIKTRTNPDTNQAIGKYYSGRGISICEEWKNDFMAFYNWSMANGYRDDLTIDRIENDGDYEPSNCRWATYKVQGNNKSNNIIIEIDGRTLTLKQWCEETGLSYSNELKAYKRRQEGIRSMEDYNRERKSKSESKAAVLKSLIEQNPSWTNAQLAETMSISVRQIQRLKKTI